MKTIKKGSKGQDVKTLQQLLNVYTDGVFGVITEEALIEYQKDNNLVPDGICGPKTWESLVGSSDNYKLVKSKRNIKEIIVHCTATKEGVNFTVDQIRKCHTDPVSKGGRGWSDIGYHYIIDLEGKVHNGRNVDIIGAHCTNHNAKSIGVVYVGGLDKNGKPKDTRNDKQKKTLRDLVNKLLALYNLNESSIHGHREFANKACPCFDVKTDL